MFDQVNLWIIVGAALLGGLTPGPATLAIAGTSMARGRAVGLALAWGVSSGSVIWAVAAALGFGALLLANQWLLETVRYAGAAYLAWLGLKSARAALHDRPLAPRDIGTASYLRCWAQGALIHLTNPKAIMFWGSIMAIGLKPGADASGVAALVGLCIAVSLTLMTSYALLFSSAVATRTYLKLRRLFETTFALFFGAAAWHLLTQRNT
ncbi:LysE family translocator [uncultured Tateyamaria sp.]|uniref:LysE family translocator n=1 Tax=uncultured Tateyamaria sp. TaxID=455651 RepID=UPI002627A966|nr:LysE family translocator [uncultured Tateyamaria sp.]